MKCTALHISSFLICNACQILSGIKPIGMWAFITSALLKKKEMKPYTFLTRFKTFYYKSQHNDSPRPFASF